MRRTGEAEPQPALAVGLIRRPFGPGIDRDAGRERGLIELLRVDVVGQLDPQEDAALRLLELGRSAEFLVERFHQGVELGAQVRVSSVGDVRRKMRRAIFRQHHLLERAGAGVGLERQRCATARPSRATM